MALPSRILLWKLALLQSSAVLLHSGSSVPAAAGSSVVSESAVSWAAGARAVLRCQSPRMVWTQDRLHDRQRVLHWDLRGPGGGPARRLLDLYSAGEQRVYEARDRGRLELSASAFDDGNFSLLIRAVEETDAGLYTCNLHHHYCHLYESLAVRLEVTDGPPATPAYWDGEKEVLAVARGAPALLTCVNRGHMWTDRHVEEAQQVVHWDRQPPGVPHDRADRLLDLYASGERRAYGPLFLRDRVAVGADAFERGDFSLRIEPLEAADEGTYSCHLHHHYCGLHERRVFHLTVAEPHAEPPPRGSPGNGSSHSGAPGPDPTLARGHNVINVIVPESRAHFFQQLGYVLATLLLFILLLVTVLLAARRRRGGYEYSDQKSGKSKGKDVNLAEFAVAAGDQTLYRSEDIQLACSPPTDYKNNILKERAELAHSPLPAKYIDLDKDPPGLCPLGAGRHSWKTLPSESGSPKTGVSLRAGVPLLLGCCPPSRAPEGSSACTMQDSRHHLFSPGTW
ncbi:matrix remodeling-associated protein 8 isoform X2 [Theropithecus gelada]|uniref:matrix remodeling-associated protein 8 isoform X2 n=1 Tax=Theropithecus gelada TaxID=9565 RepID=UPI000DC15E70|nr:matrix remodeling-associated protein 8 isoform X2 [Theropithecus gelada]XP_025230293.1 matrix remodeling-associated protein 8 isoform X2 [Theropithecus gelada]